MARLIGFPTFAIFLTLLEILLAGQQLNPKIRSTNPQLRAELAHLKLCGRQLEMVHDIRYLGARFGFHPGSRATVSKLWRGCELTSPPLDSLLSFVRTYCKPFGAVALYARSSHLCPFSWPPH